MTGVRQEQSGRQGTQEPYAVPVDGGSAHPSVAANIILVDEWKVVATFQGQRYTLRFEAPYPGWGEWRPGPPIETVRALDAAWMAFKEHWS